MSSSRDRQLDLLRIVCCVAWADGDMSVEEGRLLALIEARYFGADDKVGAGSSGEHLSYSNLGELQLEQLIERLESVEDRLLALKLANMMARVSKRQQDTDLINPEEKAVYRRLVEGLDLSESQIQEAEWAAEMEVSTGRNIWTLIGNSLSGLGAWPSAEMLEKPVGHWL